MLEDVAGNCEGLPQYVLGIAQAFGENPRKVLREMVEVTLGPRCGPILLRSQPQAPLEHSLERVHAEL